MPRTYTFEEMQAAFLEWRDIDSPCSYCGGSGIMLYGNTSTWRGGIGGQAMTNSVCCECWGSGEDDRPWTNLRDIQNHIRKEIDRGKENIIERLVGAEYYKEELFAQLCEVLEKETRKRTAAHDYKFMVRRIINLFKDLGKKEETGK